MKNMCLQNKLLAWALIFPMIVAFCAVTLSSSPLRMNGTWGHLSWVPRENPKPEWKTIFSKVSNFSPDTLIQTFPIMAKTGQIDPFSSFFLLGSEMFSKPTTLAEIESAYGAPDKKETMIFSDEKGKKIETRQAWTWGAAVFQADAPDAKVEAFGFDMSWVNEHFHGPVSDKPEPYSTLGEAKQFTEELKGSNTLTIKNPNKKATSYVVLRSRAKGKHVEIRAKKEVRLLIPNGHYIIYYEISDAPGILHKMRSFGLKEYGAKVILGEIANK